MPSLGPAEILVVLVIALLVFGPNKMPDIARQVGKGFREFRRVQQHLKSELRDVVSEFDTPTDASVQQQPAPMLPPKEDPPADATTPAVEIGTPGTEVGPPAGEVGPTAAGASSPNGASLPTPEPDAPSDPA
jgi:sec-independent protein translocase protein TatA